MAQKADITTLDQLVETFDLPSWEDIYEVNLDYIGSGSYQAYEEALDEGMSEDDAEETRERAEESLIDELFSNWHDTVEAVVDDLYGEHGLKLVGKGRQPHEYKIKPINSWADAADAIRRTINGVGDFFFEDLQEFLASGPYTARQAVLSHLSYIAFWPEVYGYGAPRRMYERSWRR